MAEVNEIFMSRVKYGIVNLALITFVITVACTSTWAIATAALWQSILAAYVAFIWYEPSMHLLPGNRLAILLPLLALPLLFIYLPLLHIPNFLVPMLQVFVLFHNLFDYFILLTPLKPYFMSTALEEVTTTLTTALDSIHDVLREAQVRSAPSIAYTLTEVNPVPAMQYQVNNDPCILCLSTAFSEHNDETTLVFAEGNDHKPNHPLQAFYHSACWKNYKKSVPSKSISVMPHENEPGRVRRWYTGIFMKGDPQPEPVKITRCQEVKEVRVSQTSVVAQ
jgi:hypothetical protein